MSAVPSEMTEAMLQAAHEAAHASRGLDWRSAEQTRWAAITAVMPKQDDSARLVWAMDRIGMHAIAQQFTAHVLSNGGVGDINDCRVFIDEQMANPQKPDRRLR